MGFVLWPHGEGQSHILLVPDDLPKNSNLCPSWSWPFEVGPVISQGLGAPVLALPLPINVSPKKGRWQLLQHETGPWKAGK